MNIGRVATVGLKPNTTLEIGPGPRLALFVPGFDNLDEGRLDRGSFSRDPRPAGAIARGGRTTSQQRRSHGDWFDPLRTKRGRGPGASTMTIGERS
jgi:hypothetical protein